MAKKSIEIWSNPGLPCWRLPTIFLNYGSYPDRSVYHIHFVCCADKRQRHPLLKSWNCHNTLQETETPSDLGGYSQAKSVSNSLKGEGPATTKTIAESNDDHENDQLLDDYDKAKGNFALPRLPWRTYIREKDYLDSQF